jgi:hypothetical protein
VLGALAACFWLSCCSGSIGTGSDAGGKDAEADDAGDDGGGGDDGSGGDDGGIRPDEDSCIDTDNDGYCREVDCDDFNADVNPGANEVCGNAIDDNCDGGIDEGCQTGNAYYVDKDSIGGTCTDNGPGTLTQPWCSIDKANSTLTAGETVFVRAGTYVETIQPDNSGSSDSSRITYTKYNNETVTFTQAVYCLRLIDKSYITVTGIKFYNCERNLYLQNSSHNNISLCEFDTPAGPATWAGSRVYDGSCYNRITHCTFSRYGNESGSSGAWDDNGCVLDIGNDNSVDRSDHNLVCDNTFFYGGHHILGVYANYNVVRRNTFHNEEWYECHRPEIGGLCGDRNVILNTSYPQENIRNVIEDNFIVFAGVPPDQVSSAGLSVRTQYNIIRRNIYYFCDSSGVALSVDDGNTNDASNNYIYNNVFYKNGYLLLDNWDPRKNGLMLARWVDDAGHNPMTGVAIKNNIFHENNLHAIYYYYVEEAEQVAADNWEEAGDPGFVDLDGQADPFDFGVFDFHLLPDSPCVDNGGFLTRTTTAGDNSTVLRVEDAGYFTDGHGVVPGDIIQIEGQTATAGIAGVDYGSNTITLDTPLSWETGIGVSLPYSGDRPDQGAYESAGD